VRACREAGEERGIPDPEILLSPSAHPHFDLAAKALGVTLRRAPLDPATSRLDLGLLRKMIGPRTVMVGFKASRPSYNPLTETSASGSGRGVSGWLRGRAL
jgi:glutamate/tyrosine decarboxylase-like PLP-dependent enzyme